MGVCLRYAKDSEEAQDILQMGFIKVFEKLEMYKHQGSLEGWIRKIIVNTALDNIRKNKKFTNNIDLEKVDYQFPNYDENVIDILSIFSNPFSNLYYFFFIPFIPFFFFLISFIKCPCAWSINCLKSPSSLTDIQLGLGSRFYTFSKLFSNAHQDALKPNTSLLLTSLP